MRQIVPVCGFFFFAFVALLKNQQHPTYGLGKVRTTGGSDNTTRRTEENHRTGEMGGEWVRAAGWGGVVYSMALCSCGRMAPPLATLERVGWPRPEFRLEGPQICFINMPDSGPNF